MITNWLGLIQDYKCLLKDKEKKQMRFYIGDTVQHKTFNWLQSLGKIVEIERPIIVGGVTFSGEKYRVQWLDTEYGISDWLSGNSLILRKKA